MEARLRSIRYVTDRTTLNLTIRGEVAYAPPHLNRNCKSIQQFLASVGNIAKMIAMFAGLVTWMFLGLVGYVDTSVSSFFWGIKLSRTSLVQCLCGQSAF